MTAPPTISDLTAPDAPATLTVEAAAAVLGISRGLAYESIRAGELPVLHLGRRVLVPVPAFLAMLGVAL